ncbi:MAG: hypothetical protein KBD76_15755 [Bacteriovorax sp.]|nr:hypothetical protein [Bacteriovorax sp.]
MKKMIALTIGTILSLNLYAANHSVGSGTRGGGHVVDIDSTPYLMDLVSNSVCDWKNGADLLEELPYLKTTINKLSALDWYFAADLKKEIEFINFCFTGPLYRVPTNDWGTVVRPTTEKVQQAGYRLYGSAYIDRDIYAKMNERNESMLILHEVMHSYFDMDTLDRPLKLRSMIKVLDQVGQGSLRLREKLHYNMEMNEVMFPTLVRFLDPKKNVVLFLTGNIDDQIRAIKEVKKPEDLIDLSNDQVNSLVSWDRERVSSMDARMSLLIEALSVMMIESNVNELKELLDNKEYKEINPVGIALRSFGLMSNEKKEVILKSAYFGNILKHELEKIRDAKIRISEYLLMASPELQIISEPKGQNQTNKDLPLVSLRPQGKLSSSLMWIVEVIIFLKQNNQLELMNKEDLSKVLKLENQKQFVESSQIKIEREKNLALSVLEQLSLSLTENILSEIKKRVDEETFNKITLSLGL